MDLESFLNVAVPIAIFIFFAAVLYGKFREPVSAFFYWIGSLFGWGADKIRDAPSYSKEVVYNG